MWGVVKSVTQYGHATKSKGFSVKQMDQAARQRAASNLDALRKERNKVAEWYGGLKHGSSQAWEEVKTGFSNSSQDLQEGLKKAYNEF